MVKQYLQFCEEEQFEPLSCATLFRVLEVREASQQKSRSGLDNVAADGSAGCDDITLCLQMMHQIVKDAKNLSFYSQEQQDDFLYNNEKSLEAIIQWKAHIMRSVNREQAKQGSLAKLDQSSCLLVMDWAMKFLQLRYREKQSDWYGKKRSQLA